VDGEEAQKQKQHRRFSCEKKGTGLICCVHF
jgi:hypothetical protein